MFITKEDQTMKILISGAGIAGPTLAYWLAHYGIEPTIIEEAQTLRTGGYIIDFFGTGFEIAERMGLLPEILAKGYQVQKVRVVNGKGRPCRRIFRRELLARSWRSLHQPSTGRSDRFHLR